MLRLRGLRTHGEELREGKRQGQIGRKFSGDKAKGKGKTVFGRAAPYGISKGKGNGSVTEVNTYGYQGTCWKCNLVGHKAWECQAIGVAVVDGDEVEEEEVECGSVWMIARVEEMKSEF